MPRRSLVYFCALDEEAEVHALPSPAAKGASGFADTLTGDAAGNLLAGLGGADLLDGGDGDDTLVGGNTPTTFEQDVATLVHLHDEVSGAVVIAPGDLHRLRRGAGHLPRRPVQLGRHGAAASP